MGDARSGGRLSGDAIKKEGGVRRKLPFPRTLRFNITTLTARPRANGNDKSMRNSTRSLGAITHPVYSQLSSHHVRQLGSFSCSSGSVVNEPSHKWIGRTATLQAVGQVDTV
jgi:hypothetical protein